MGETIRSSLKRVGHASLRGFFWVKGSFFFWIVLHSIHSIDKNNSMKSMIKNNVEHKSITNGCQ